ncbi:hypothetical protein F5144DRAFT_378859 [Chaetomium tenue]|uniref:Uncharacterized protein n=1 Tax=Chaetomium tenue TaxID=1854479 RepID=A0ACB7NUJ8_9PEZI|nr:hypothetical protein F5144DRAFT_378859 [Chaetomium globosum]
MPKASPAPEGKKKGLVVRCWKYLFGIIYPGEPIPDIGEPIPDMGEPIPDPEAKPLVGPNADVRIDNIILPEDLYRVCPTNTHFSPDFTSRDPDCERERPMINVVLPTPPLLPNQQDVDIPPLLQLTDEAQGRV